MIDDFFLFFTIGVLSIITMALFYFGLSATIWGVRKRKIWYTTIGLALLLFDLTVWTPQWVQKLKETLQ